jgi:hypothetical protein
MLRERRRPITRRLRGSLDVRDRAELTRTPWSGALLSFSAFADDRYLVSRFLWS